MGKTVEEYTKGPIRSKKLLRLVLCLFISILVMLLIVRVLSGLHKMVILPVRKVQIYGTQYAKNSQILKAANLDAVKSLILFNKVKAKASLLKDKRIKGVEIVKLYPDTLKIYVVEKEAGMLLYIDNQIYAMSDEGVLLAETDVPEGYDVPLILLNIKNDDINISIGSSLDNFMVKDISVSMRMLKKKYPDFYGNIRVFNVNDDGVYVSLNDNNHEIYFGSTVTVEKLEKLYALLIVLNKSYKDGDEGVWEIDMSFSHAAVRKREPEYELR